MILSKTEISRHISNKKKYSKYPKLPNVVLQNCTEEIPKHGKVFTKVTGEYKGNSQAVNAFKSRVDNWYKNEQSTEQEQFIKRKAAWEERKSSKQSTIDRSGKRV